MLRSKIIIFFLFYAISSFAQNDTTQRHGTIKVVKPHDGEIYIMAIADFANFELPKVNHDFSKEDLFQPVPVVKGYSNPFNYTKYFNNKFKSEQIDLKGKTIDTVIFEIKVLANGKTYIKDKSKTMMISGLPAVYNEKEAGFELNSLHLNCLTFLKNINQWLPGYVVFPKKDKFKGETVIKPVKNNVTVTGSIMIIFSTIPFEEDF
ncbi:MAG: hypothetical protein A3F72_17375 [Bacteroidetes bacterium RIFCSPLOWO2_12_FULL_35_15]|nr:MAG: hypothetical protein A3F72_17375 [Bacteroidetes bacterium RIFCSPLOWO2_12_FULL_35_15]